MPEKLSYASAHKNASESLAQLLLAAKMIEPASLEEASRSAKRLDVPLDTALIMLKSTSETHLRTAVQANEMLMKGKIDLDLAIRALRLAKQNGVAFEDALNVMGTIVNKTQQMPALGNPLIELLLAAHIITPSQIGQVLQQSKDSEMSIGRTLIVNRILSRSLLQEAITAYSLVKEEKISRTQCEQALQTAIQRRVGLLQVLFEQGDYNECSGETLKLSELVAMAGFLGESDLLDCLEISISQDKPFGQVMLDAKLITASHLEAACSILDMIGSCLKPFQAAEALKQVRAREVSVYQAVAELQPPPQVPQRPLTLSDLIIEASLQTRQSIDAAIGNTLEPGIKIGKQLMSAGLISEACLYKALRCHSLFKEGIISADQAVALMKACKEETVSIEEALSKAGLNLPLRMHWSWV